MLLEHEGDYGLGMDVKETVCPWNTKDVMDRMLLQHEGDYDCIHAQNHNCLRVPRAYGSHCIHAQTLISFVFQEHMVTFTSMPKSAYFSCHIAHRTAQAAESRLFKHHNM